MDVAIVVAIAVADELPKKVADAWAAVLIDIDEKRKATAVGRVASRRVKANPGRSQCPSRSPAKQK
jgi:hypothetical protein